jgi:superfamily II DNA or RNA helicase
MVREIVHGKRLIEIGEKNELKIEFVQGSTEGNVREEIKQALDSKQIKCVVCTDVFKEGINIPGLNVLVLAAGGKSEISVIQAIGRGLRKTDEKEAVEIIDFLDPYKYLENHSKERKRIYNKNEWEVQEVTSSFLEGRIFRENGKF